MFRRFRTSGNSGPRGLPPGRRLYAIGDIHGRLDLLETLLELIEADRRKRTAAVHELVFLGDMIDRGPDSAGVVRRVLEYSRVAPVTALMGNHEAAMIAAIENSGAMTRWLRIGGDQSLISWGVSQEMLKQGTSAEIREEALALVPRDQLAWLTGLPQHLHVGGYYFVHAGVRPGTPLDRQAPQDSYWIRDEFLSSTRNHGAMIVHGHNARPTVQMRGNRIGIDTGAYRSHRLTALGLEGAERWLVQT